MIRKQAKRKLKKRIIEVQIFKNTVDSDLFHGLEVCYKNLNGAFTKLGIITDTIIKDGVLLYLINTSFGAYTADELKLIEHL